MTPALLLLIAAVAWGLALLLLRSRDPPLRWDWSRFDPQDLSFARQFPANFRWGAAVSAWQVEGGIDGCNWSRWETAVDAQGRPRIANGERPGLACDHANRFREDFALARALGLDAWRFSLEWSRLEPEPGAWNAEAAARTHAMLDAMEEIGLEPMITLHHFTHPLWFEDLGSFEREENIAHFVRFAERAFSAFGGRVRRWCTFNEPEVFATQGWFTGFFPPGKRAPALCGQVMRNLLLAHGRTWRALKAHPNGHDVEIGIVKNIFQFEPARPWHLGDAWMAWLLDGVWNEGLIEGLHTGHLRLSVPGLLDVDAAVVEAAGAFDFVGLNYYSHFYVRFRPDRAQPFDLVQRPGEVMTDLPYPIYPEGLYRAIRRLRILRAPIWITENGIPDARDDRRDLFIRRSLYAVSRALADGMDVRGYFYWSLLDNFEWHEGWRPRFGLYAMEHDTRERRLRTGAEALRAVIAASRATAAATAGTPAATDPAR